MLDSRAPPSQYDSEEKAREEATEKEVQRLMRETRLWRVANTAQWVLWGIVQAKVDGMEEQASEEAKMQDKGGSSARPQSDPLSPEVAGLREDSHHDRPESRAKEEANEEGDAEGEGEFDYLTYAQDRAMFFWGDILSLELVKPEELPQKLVQHVKIVDY